MSHEDQSKALISKLISSGEIVSSQSSPATVFMGEIESAKMSSAKIENVVFEKLALQDVLFKESVFRNVTFNNCVFHKVDFDDSALENVVFNNCRIKSFNPVGATFKNVKFIRSKIHSASFHSSSGKILAEESDFYHLNLGKSQVNWAITNSTLNKIEAFKIGGSITLKDSTFTDANLEFGEMDSFEAYNSTIDALGPTTIRNQLVIKGGKVEWSGMNAGSVHVDGISAQRFSMSYGDMGNVVIENCRKLGVLGFSQSKVDTLHVRNCKIDDFGGHATIANRLQLEDVSIHDLVLAESDIQRWKMNNVKLTGKLNFELGTIREKQFTNVDVDRKAVINLRNTTFSFP